MTIHAVSNNMQIENVIVDYRDRPEGSESKLNTYSDGIKVLGTIGRLYINRIKKGMRLQADPTIRFALQDYTIRRITRKHLGVKSPYNTYSHAGLPPGPIRTTSRTTIDAILDSTPNEYLYMCAREDFSGRHNFAKTFEEHSRNARKYQKALNSRGIH